MLTVSEAYNKAYESIVDVLTEAGLVHGITLTPEQIVTTSDIIFWETFQKEDKAVRKNSYVIFDIDTLNPFEFADGLVVGRKVVATVSIYSQSRNLSALMTLINQAFINNKWTFEQKSAKSFDSTTDKFTIDYTIECLIYE